ADRMLDMGFLPDIRRILAHVPKPEQTLFFSATMPPPIEALTRNILVDPVRVTLQKRAAPARGVTQVVYPVPEKRKAALLLALLDQGIVEDALVFTRTKHRADRLTRVLVKHGVRAERIHGNRSQPQRTRALDGFKQGDFQILVATDIAARGIDVEALGHVVNFDVPTVPEDYIHRSGRTGRAQATGEAVTLVSPEEEGTLRQIQRAVGATLPRRTLEGFAYHDDSDAPLEVPLAERIAEIRARKKADRERAREKAAAKEARAAGAQSRAADDRSVEDRSGSGSGEGAGRRRRRRGGKRKTQAGKAGSQRQGSTPAQRDGGPSSPRGKGPAAGRGKKSSPGRGTPGRSAGGGETRPGGGETERSGPPQQGRRPHTRRRRP
ncbi:MAG: DEAD/DEAH box helicase, partial [Gemmatimonadetes bacterium]|nr:DEAD/DEAH box helicase [Gemmatimonadota bacterium]